MAQSQVSGADGQATPHGQQKIVIVANLSDKRHNTGPVNSNSTKVDGSGSKVKKQKRAQKAVVNKYQQIP